MTVTIRKLPANRQGKDYVVGDLHGCYDLLERLLIAVDFDKTHDRLFSVGDMIDRGPDSLRCLQLLAEPWFFAVQGNHELMMLNFFLPYLLTGSIAGLNDSNETGFLDYGGDWVEAYFQVSQKRMSIELNQCIAMTLELPLVWVVGDGENRFHVIHAELVRPNYKTAEQVVWLDSDIDRWLKEQAVPAEIEHHLCWGRTLMLSELGDLDNAKIQPGLSTTFCGHTYATKPRHVLSHLCLDTGAFVSHMPYDYDEDDGFGLTLFDVQASRWVWTSYQQDGVVRGDFP
jgi:serine/threonine protein phosphatase 1